MTDLSTLTFEQLLEALETITRRMATGDIGIEAVADLYEEAGRLQAEAAERLERVRRRLDGLALDPPMAGAGPAGAEPAAPRSARPQAAGPQAGSSSAGAGQP